MMEWKDCVDASLLVSYCSSMPKDMYQYNIVHQSLKVQSAYLYKIKYPQNAYAVTEKHENMPYS